MTERDGEFFPPSVPSRRQPQLANVIAPELGGLLTKWHYHFQAQTAQKQNELFTALEMLFKSQQRALQANLTLELTLVDLEFLEDFKELRRDEIRAEIIIRRNALATELFNRGVDCMMLMRAAKERLSPTPSLPKPEPKERPDPISVAIDDAISGGGKYTQTVRAAKERFIREKGRGLTEEEEDRFRNAEQVAKEAENGRR